MTIPRVAFFGSPDFAVPTLTSLIESPYRPCVVVTQPDRPAGRGRTPRPSPVKVVAQNAGIDVLQPARLRDPEATAALAEYGPELQVIAAYGQILRPDVLALPRFGTLNVHASLLPRWRGASPVAAAILAGDAETGATIMLVDEGEDTGDILTARAEAIRPDDDAGSLGDRLAALGASLLLETIPAWLAGEIAPRPQDASRATRARRLRKAQGRIDWTRPAAEIARQVRAFSPWPGATTRLRADDLRIWRARAEGAGAAGPPGTVIGVGETIDVATGDGLLRVERLQRAGKRAMDARAFANGEPDLPGQRLGEPA
ncbi:MAG: methionyl-tRNA formyltransferase [Chloroflexi bacterium]|nr:methionyl-tRNA formyltransferase [Chloroflexota bacterium]